MSVATEFRVVGSELFFLPITNRVPLKFGPETVTSVTCARVCATIEDTRGNRAKGWGETPLSVQWVWPSQLDYEVRHEQLREFCCALARDWVEFDFCGDPIQVGHRFQQEALAGRLQATNAQRSGEPMPHLAALVCCSPFDVAIHDAYGNLHGRPIYEIYNAETLNEDLSAYLTAAEDTEVSFAGKYPGDFVTSHPPRRLPAWHLVGGLDAIAASDLNGSEPDDGYPVLLDDWIQRDGLTCLKIKLRGNNVGWDYERIVRVGQVAIEHNACWLSTDFNCTVTNPQYVDDILDRLLHEHPRIYGMILYVEQPFPYDLNRHRIDVHSTSARKPLFMDESAHNWKIVRLGRQLGWTGVALKTCKTQTEALLSLCWAKAHGMTLMVQDLTNPMLAQIPHVQLAAYAGTIMGIETNSMQFYPTASLPESKVHPGIYQRRSGMVDWSSVSGPGFGYRVSEIERELPAAKCSFAE